VYFWLAWVNLCNDYWFSWVAICNHEVSVICCPLICLSMCLCVCLSIICPLILVACFYTLRHMLFMWGDYDLYGEHVIACRKVGHCDWYLWRYSAKIGKFGYFLKFLVVCFCNLRQILLMLGDYDCYGQYLSVCKKVGHCDLYLGRNGAKIGIFGYFLSLSWYISGLWGRC
jgi:hypothetical protein